MRRCFVWTLPGSNQRPSDYESDALTDWAKGPGQLAVTSLQLTLQSTDQLPTDNWKLKTENWKPPTASFRSAKLKQIAPRGRNIFKFLYYGLKQQIAALISLPGEIARVWGLL